MARRKKTEYDWSKLEFDETILTKHFNQGRSGGRIQFVVVHHMATLGDGKGKALDACHTTWQTRKASAHYGVDGSTVRQFVWDSNAAWHSGNETGNRCGIGIEHANASLGPEWKVADQTWKTGARLAAYIHLVHQLGRPVKDGTIRKHSSFKATACPGPFIDARWDAYVKEAQRVYDELTGKAPASRSAARAARAGDGVRVPAPRMTRGPRVDQALALLEASTHKGSNLAHVQAAIEELKKVRQTKVPPTKVPPTKV